MMKKMQIIFLVLIATTALFANGSKETSEVASGSKEPVVINYYEWDLPNEDFIAEFNAANPDIKVVVHQIPANGERATKLDILAMSGSDMDVMPIADGDQFLRFENGMLANLDEFIKRDNFDMEKNFGKYADWGKGTDGSVYGIPFRATQTMVFYNIDMFDAAGVAYPTDDWTYNEYIEKARQMAAWGKDKGIFGTYTHTYANEWATIAGQAGTWYTSEGLSNIRDTPWVKALTTRKMLDSEGTQMPFGQIKAVKAVINSSFLGEKQAMVTAGSWLVRDMKNKDKFPFDFKIGVATMPRYDESIEGKRSNFSCSILGIPENSKHKEEAWRFIRFYVEKASSTIAASGNMPTYLPSYDEEIVEIFRSRSGLEKEFAEKFFDKNLILSTNKIMGPSGAKYMQVINEEVTQYFTGERLLEDTLARIESRVNKEILGK